MVLGAAWTLAPPIGRQEQRPSRGASWSRPCPAEKDSDGKEGHEISGPSYHLFKSCSFQFIHGARCYPRRYLFSSSQVFTAGLNSARPTAKRLAPASSSMVWLASGTEKP